MVKIFKTCSLWLLMQGMDPLQAQDYHAVQGSNYAGSLGVYNNPAAMVNTPVKWDVTIAGIQAKYQTNAIRIADYSLLSSPANSQFFITGGSKERYGNAQANINLFTTRIAWGRNRAISFGANLRSGANFSTSEYNYRDTVSSVQSFMTLNEATGPYSAKMRMSTAVELCLSYGQTILRGGDWRLNGGLTVKVNRGLAGAQGTVTNISKTTTATPTGIEYQLTGGSLIYGYSSNIDHLNGNYSRLTNIANLVRYSRSGASVDLGLEWLKLPDNGPAYTQGEDDYYDYEWKVSASVLDIGWAQYRYGAESRRATIPANGPTATEIDQHIDSTVKSLSDFTNAIAQLVPVQSAGTDYKIFSPARINLNVDRWLMSALYLNADINVNIGSLCLGKNRYILKSMNRVRVTPRYEVRRWGLYLPLQYNANNQFWVGAAGRLGPLLVGVHNLANLFSKTSMASGGGYIALTIRSSQFTGTKKEKKYDCPTY